LIFENFGKRLFGGKVMRGESITSWSGLGRTTSIATLALIEKWNIWPVGFSTMGGLGGLAL